MATSPCSSQTSCVSHIFVVICLREHIRKQGVERAGNLASGLRIQIRGASGAFCGTLASGADIIIARALMC